jgi:hypothetical protein
MTPVALGISRGPSSLSSKGRPAGASFTDAEMRERCGHQPGHVREAAFFGRAEHDDGDRMMGARIDHEDEVAAGEAGVAGLRKEQAGTFGEVSVGIGEPMANAFERPDTDCRMRGGLGDPGVTYEQLAREHGDVMRGAVTTRVRRAFVQA